MSRRRDHGLDLERIVGRSPARQLVLEPHLHENGHLHRGVYQLLRALQPIRMDGYDRAPDAVLVVNLRQDLRRSFLAQLGPGKNLGDLLLEDLLGRTDDRRQRQPGARFTITDTQPDPGNSDSVADAEVGPEFYEFGRLLGNEVASDPRCPAIDVVVCREVAARSQSPDRRDLCQIDDAAAIAVQRFDEYWHRIGVTQNDGS